MARGRAGRWRTGVLAGDGGEDGAEVAVGERAPGEQRLQQGVVPPRQRRHGPSRSLGNRRRGPATGTRIEDLTYSAAGWETRGRSEGGVRTGGGCGSGIDFCGIFGWWNWIFAGRAKEEEREPEERIFLRRREEEGWAGPCARMGWVTWPRVLNGPYEWARLGLVGPALTTAASFSWAGSYPSDRIFSFAVRCMQSTRAVGSQ